MCADRPAGDRPVRIFRFVGRGENESAPVGVRALAYAPSGAARVDRSTTGRWSGVSLRLDLFTSPVSPCGVAGDAAFGLDTGLPASNPWHRFTLTRLPEPSVLAPGTDLAESSWGGPSSFGSFPRLRCLLGAQLRTEVRPKATSVPGCLAAPLAGCGLPRALRTIQQVSVSAATRRRRRSGLTRRPPRFPATSADSSLPPTSRRSPTARSEVAVNTVRVPIPLRLVSGVGWAEAPSSPLRLACAFRNEHQ